MASATEPVRLSKLMAARGICSRREADSYIERGWVFVDGRKADTLGIKVDPGCDIRLAPEADRQQQRRVTILLNKPVGYVSGQPEPGYKPAVTLVTRENQYRENVSRPPHPASHPAPSTGLRTGLPRDRGREEVEFGGARFSPAMLSGLAPAGRLDIDSTGLLVLTQDGRIARQLIGDDSEIEKEYLVRVSGQPIENGLALLNHGLSLDGRKLRPAKVRWLNEDQLRFILKEGKKRQIRRMCELVGLEVTGLKRVRIGRVKLGDLPMGKWRLLRENERF
jgi:23S rRNA pseudouridine2604 synthase